jgi:hypothetical protein
VTRLTLWLGLALAAGVVAGTSAVAGPPAPADLVAEWTQQWDTAVKESAKDYKKIADKYEKNLEATSAYTRRFILRYLPDDEETRKWLGYGKSTPAADGSPTWVRDEVRHDQINEFVDTDDPNSTKYKRDVQDAGKRIVNRFKGLAKKATANGAAKDAPADAKWNEKAEQAWNRVLELDDGTKDFEEAHKALNHPRFEGKYCSPFKFKFMQARNERRKAGERENAQEVKGIDAVEPDGTMPKAGLTGGGAKSPHVVVNTTHGKDVARKFATAFEKGLIDLVDVVGFPPEAKERCFVRKLTMVKDEDEWKTALAKGLDWKQAEIQRHIDAHFGGAGPTQSGEYVRHGDDGVNSEDFCMNIAAMMTVMGARGLAAAEFGGGQGQLEDWLGECIAYDVTARVHGTKSTHWGAFGRYGETVEAPPGQDKWIELARRLVIADDDVPISALWKKTLQKQDLKGPDLVKGWALIQFLYERDKDSARKFILTAVAKGTPEACAEVFGGGEGADDPAKAMDRVDAEYHEWVLKAW